MRLLVELCRGLCAVPLRRSAGSEVFTILDLDKEVCCCL